jgi:hypothetical protein
MEIWYLRAFAPCRSLSQSVCLKSSGTERDVKPTSSSPLAVVIITRSLTSAEPNSANEIAADQILQVPDRNRNPECILQLTIDSRSYFQRRTSNHEPLGTTSTRSTNYFLAFLRSITTNDLDQKMRPTYSLFSNKTATKGARRS